MPALSPIQIAIAVIAVVSLVGVIITSMRKSALLAGYGDYRIDIEKLARNLRLEMFRDGDDVVLTGNYKNKPLQIRFSYSETTPGLNIRMQAPVSFTFSVVPKGAQSTEGRVLVRTGDEMFDARFAARTDHPTQAKMLVGSKAMRLQMEKLCCSSKTFLTLTTGNIELSELVIPQSTTRHVTDHLDSMAYLADAVDDIPGAEKIKIVPYRREKSTPIFRIAIALGAITALIAVFVMQSPSANAPLTEGGVAAAPPGILPVDVSLINKADRWRGAEVLDFSSEAANWIRSYGLQPVGRFELDTDGNDMTDVAYFLATDDGQRRVVLLQDRVNIYDSVYNDLVAVVRVPRSSLSSIEWKKPPAEEPAGDALLLLRGTPGNLRGLVVFPVGGRIITANAANYANIGLR